MKRAFHTYDVFTQTRFAGNPLAIVSDGAGLDTATMQAIAREFNLSETVFLLPPEDPGHSAKARIFTPGMELPFAGHPTVGTAIFLAGERAREGVEPVSITLELAVGPVQAAVAGRAGKPPHAVFDIPQLAEEIGEAPPVEAVAAALALAPGEIGFETHRPSLFSAGNPFCFVPVKSLDAVARAQVVQQHWDEAFIPGRCPAAYVYTRETVDPNAAFHARMFWPAIGVG
ncbi:MAG: PhzF family phenazine biosynthesis protein, partial [Alphaproteobacteria bacterium]